MRMRSVGNGKRISSNLHASLKLLPAAESKRMGKKNINVEITAWGWQKVVVFGIMSVKVRISYEKSWELHTVLELLKPVVRSCKTGKGENGRYRRAYLEVDIPDGNVKKSANSPLV